jgi:elongation factor G
VLTLTPYRQGFASDCTIRLNSSPVVLGHPPVFPLFHLAFYHQVIILGWRFLRQVFQMDSALNRAFYRETVQDSGVADGKVIRQRGGIGVYAHVRVEVRALSRGQGKTVAWNAGLNIPAEFVSPVLQGIKDGMDVGVLAELELTDIGVSVEDGSYHEIDSTADAFREAAKTAVTEAIQQARPVILEAFSLVTVTVPPNFVEVVGAALTSHGGQAKATLVEAQSRTFAASLPASNVSNLISELLRLTNGSASISSCSDGFRPRPDPPDSAESWVLTR